MKGITKRRTKTYSDKEELQADLVDHCEQEYEATFGHKWNEKQVAHVMSLVGDIHRRWQLETEAWAMMNKFRKVAEEALKFFKSRGLEEYRPDHGVFYAYKLHKLLEKRRPFLKSLVKDVRKDYRRPPDRRHWLAWTMNVAKMNPFGTLPYGRKLTDRELAIISVLMTGASEVEFKLGMTIGDALDQERRRMTLARRRAPLRNRKRKKK